MSTTTQGVSEAFYLFFLMIDEVPVTVAGVRRLLGDF